MGNILCIVPKINSFLDHYIMSTKDNGNSLILIVDESIYNTIKEKYTKYDTIKNIYKYNSSTIYDINTKNKKLNDKIKQLKCNQTIILDKLKNKSFRFIEDIHQQDYAHLYPFVRFSYLLGIKKIYAYNIGSYLNLSIPSILEDFVDIHKGKRAFIVGNGPSLNDINMTLLKNEITFGSNRVYLGFEKWGFEFNYWTIIDKLQIEEHLNEWSDETNLSKNIKKFIPFEYKNLMNLKNYCPINFHYNYLPFPKFSINPTDIYLGNTVVHMSLQIACIMGFSELYLIGVDHNYNLNKTIDYKGAQIWTNTTTNAQTHFDARYNDPKQNRRFITPKPDKSEQAFKHAYFFTKKHGISVLNASPNTMLKNIPTVKYESLF